MKRALLLSLLITGLVSCQKEFDPTGGWQESYAVYCLLNLKDSVQYVRVNRVFLTTDNPSQYFGVPDSVNTDPSIMEVSMITLKEGVPEGDPVFFSPTDSFPKEDGMFAQDKYYVYRSPVMLKADCSYRLIIRNLETGFRMQAETKLMGNRPLGYSYIETRFYNITQYHPESIDYHGSLITSQFEKRIIRLLYYEFEGENKLLKYVDWRSPYFKSSGSLSDTAQISDELLKYFADNIPVDPNVRRKAVGIDKMLIVNDENLTMFIDFTNQGLSGQYFPEISNFDHGIGILASRYYYTFFAMRLKPETLDTLAYGRYTRALGFADANGNWPPTNKDSLE
jgi:hypothetical protein